MIELLIEAERALSAGALDRAEQLYRQVAEADPHNSIAVVGLARVALERADELGAYLLARRALRMDPENEAARRLAARLEEVLAARGEPVMEPLGPTAAAQVVPSTPEPPEPAAAAAPIIRPNPKRRGLLGRFRRSG